MKTITKEYTVYSFDELNEDAKEKAHSEHLQNSFEWPWACEAEHTMEEVEKLFHIKLRNWSIGTYRPEYPDIHFCDNFGDFWEQEERKELSGNRARAFLWNNFGHVLFEMKHYGKYEKNASGVWRYKRYSKVLPDSRVYDGTCPLTGMCFDNDALDSLAEFCFGVEWDEGAKKRVPSSRLLKSEKHVTVEDIIRDCVHSMFKAFIDDLEFHESRECFEEDCKANEWTFLEDGTMFN